MGIIGMVPVQQFGFQQFEIFGTVEFPGSKCGDFFFVFGRRNADLFHGWC
jgi:hypothetical protein